MASRSERTEKPTAKRRRDARRKGQVPRSREVPFAATFLLMVIALGFTGSVFLVRLQGPFRLFWAQLGRNDITVGNVQGVFLEMGRAVFLLAGPFLLLIFVVSLFSLVGQSGLVFSAEPLKFKPDKLNPVNNLKKVFSKSGLVQMAKSLLLVSVIVWLSWTVVSKHIHEFQLMIVMDVASIVATWGEILYEVSLRAALCLVILAIGDFIFQRYSYEESLRMTKQEVKDEFKDTEGDPTVKGRIRRMQRELARQRMMAAVPEADVVVTNPTHFAVALKFDMETMDAPEVVAKGQDHLARKIRAIAEESHVPIVEEVELAQTLYHTVGVGEEVPVQLYRAVAQILAYVYRLKQQTYH